MFLAEGPHLSRQPKQRIKISSAGIPRQTVAGTPAGKASWMLTISYDLVENLAKLRYISYKTILIEPKVR
jgi:hypothetical protein